MKGLGFICKKGVKTVFSKLEMFGAITISLIGGMAIGYSKARELCLQAIIKATGEQTEPEAMDKEETP